MVSKLGTVLEIISPAADCGDVVESISHDVSRATDPKTSSLISGSFSAMLVRLLDIKYIHLGGKTRGKKRRKKLTTGAGGTTSTCLKRAFCLGCNIEESLCSSNEGESVFRASELFVTQCFLIRG